MIGSTFLFTYFAEPSAVSGAERDPEKPDITVWSRPTSFGPNLQPEAKTNRNTVKISVSSYLKRVLVTITTVNEEGTNVRGKCDSCHVYVCRRTRHIGLKATLCQSWNAQAQKRDRVDICAQNH